MRMKTLNILTKSEIYKLYAFKHVQHTRFAFEHFKRILILLMFSGSCSKIINYDFLIL